MIRLIYGILLCVKCVQAAEIYVRHFLSMTNGKIDFRAFQPFFTVRGSPATMK